MTGKIKKIIDLIIEKNSKGNQSLANLTKAKLMLKGIAVDKYDSTSLDNQRIIKILNEFIKDLDLDIKIEELEERSNIIFSTKYNEFEVIKDIKTQIPDKNIKFVMYFASIAYTQDVICKGIKKLFPDAEVIGCSCVGQFINDKRLSRSVVMMIFDDEIIEDAKIEIFNNSDKPLDVKETLSSFESYYSTKLKDMDFEKYLGFILMDLKCDINSNLIERIGDLTNVFFVGGVASENINYPVSMIHINGEIYSNSAVLALIKTKNKFEILKTQSFNILNKKFQITKIDDIKTIVQLNHRPAAEVYAESIGLPVEELPAFFQTYPLSITIDGEPFVKTVKAIDNGKILMHGNIKNDIEINLLQATDIVADTKKNITNKLMEQNNIWGIINFNCLFRTLELEKNNTLQDYLNCFKDIPHIGFDTYGEKFLGNLNLTSIIVVFYKDLIKENK